LTINFNLHGDLNKPLLVFLHGGGVSSWMWDEQVRYFNTYTCLVPDLPGHGKSNNGYHFSIQDTASEILTIIEKHRTDQQVTVIGFSLGAQVLLSMLSEDTNLIDQAVIISASTKSLPFPRIAAKTATWMLPLARNKMFSRMQAKYMYLNDRYFNDYYQETKSMTKETFYKVMYENISFSLPKGFKTAHSRMLVMIGKKENSIIKRSLADILENNEKCSGIVIPGVGHGIPLHSPKYFNQLLKNWIENEKTPNDVMRIS